MRKLRWRVSEWLSRPFAWMFQSLLEHLVGVLEGLVGVSDRLADVSDRLERLGLTVAAIEERSTRSEALLRALAAEESANHRRLTAMRGDAEYASAFDDDEPLVTISVITRQRTELLVERSLASIFAQTYEHLEVIVVGDDASEETQAALRSLRDPRLHFVNLTTRVVRDSPHAHWLAAGTLPRNEAYRLARGTWLLDFDDDDALLPTAVQDLLRHAQCERAEVAYGQFNQHAPSGEVEVLGRFPPQPGQFSLAGALVHGGLRFFARELHAADIGVPSDVYRMDRMLRAGVRFSHLRTPVFDYYPSSLWGSRLR